MERYFIRGSKLCKAIQMQSSKRSCISSFDKNLNLIGMLPEVVLAQPQSIFLKE